MNEAAKQFKTTEDIINTLICDAEKMGLTPDVCDLLEGFDEYKRRLEVKVRELSIIEAIAMESMDENIKDLREQLFMAVKLIHSDEIIEVINGYNREDMVVGIHFNSNVETEVKDKISKYDVMERIRKYLNKRAEYKKMKESTRKLQPIVIQQIA